MFSEQQGKAAYQGGAISGSMGNVLGAEVRQLEVPAELERLSKAVEYASHSLSELCNRLEGRVVRGSEPQPATAGTAQGISAGPCTLFGQEVRGNTNRIENLGERVQDLLRRLEV